MSFTAASRISRSLCATNGRLRPCPSQLKYLFQSSSLVVPARWKTSSAAETAIPVPPLEEDEVDIQDEGEYEIILPPEDLRPGTIPPEKSLYHRLQERLIQKPPYALPEALKIFKETREFDEGAEGEIMIQLGTMEEYEVRSAGAIAARILKSVGTHIMSTRTPLTTENIDDMVTAHALKHSVYPSPLGYRGFPRACCTSVNNIVAHGIPDRRQLRDDDIVNVDITIYHRGFHGDTSRTLLMNHVDNIGHDLVKITEEALEAGIAACGPGRPFRDIAKAIHSVIQGRNYVVCPSFTGHGIGRGFHQKPWIYHDLNEEPEIMKPGHCFTIEPCIIRGSDPNIFIWPDDWTASTTTGARSAQAEHMILVTETGIDILTRDDSWLCLSDNEKFCLLGMDRPRKL